MNYNTPECTAMPVRNENKIASIRQVTVAIDDNINESLNIVIELLRNMFSSGENVPDAKKENCFEALLAAKEKSAYLLNMLRELTERLIG